MAERVPLDFPSLSLCNRTSHKDNAHLPELTQHVPLGGPLFYLCNHTGHKDNIHLHELTKHVPLDGLSLQLCSHSGHKDLSSTKDSFLEGGGGLVKLDKQFLFVIVAHTLNVSRFPSSSEVTRAG